jgi:hypothetical protein
LGFNIAAMDESLVKKSLACAIYTPLTEILIKGKDSLQVHGDKTKNNGVTYGLFGSSGSGKTTLIRKVFLDNIYNPTKYPEYLTMLFTESKHADALQGMDKKIPVDSVGVDEGLYQWMWSMNYHYDKKYRYVVAIDDVIGVKTMPTVYKAFLTYRNMNITSIVSLQYLKLCPLSVRSSLYFVFCMPLNSNEAIEQLVRGYLAMYLPGHNIDAKIHEYKRTCVNHCSIMLDNLNHKAYYVNADFQAAEIRPPSDSIPPVLGFDNKPSIGYKEEDGEEDINPTPRKRQRTEAFPPT